MEQDKLDGENKKGTLDPAILKLFEDGLASGKLAEIGKKMVADGLSQVEIYHLFLLFAEFLGDTRRENDENWVNDNILDCIWGYCNPRWRWFDHSLTNEELHAHWKSIGYNPGLSFKMTCLACGATKDILAKEIYPYPEDGVTDEPISPLFAIDCRGSTESRTVHVCHHCLHKLGLSDWITDDRWASLNPVVPFEKLPLVGSDAEK